MAGDLIPILSRFHREVVLPDMKRIGRRRRSLRTSASRRGADRLRRAVQAAREAGSRVPGTALGIKRVEERLDALEDRMGSVERRLDSIDKKLEKLALKSELADLKARVDGLQEQIRILEERLSA